VGPSSSGAVALGISRARIQPCGLHGHGTSSGDQDRT
jgi:hypothetical protein